MSDQQTPAEFDAHAESYDEDLASGLSLSGEDKSYYARGRVEWIKRRLTQLTPALTPRRVLDFGCGDGFSTPLLREIPGVQSVTGVDVSSGLLEIANRRHRSAGIEFGLLDGSWSPTSPFDLAFTNGVFHHIPPSERTEAFRQVWNALRPAGIFAFWENNPWNPGTRLVMSRIEFDRSAITITPPEGRRMLRSAGFSILATDSLFYFPRVLRWFRGFEPLLSRLPLGGQYLILAQRP